MRNSSVLFIFYIMILTIGMLQFNTSVREHLSDSHILRQELRASYKKAEREKLRVAMLQNQLHDFQFSVAKVLPEYNKPVDVEKKYALQNLSAALRNPAASEPLDLSATLLAQGKEQFSKGEFAKAIEAFRALTQRYPASVHTVEGYFLLAESYFLNKQHNQSLDVIQLMIEQYPDQEMTGYIMLRMGLILQTRKHVPEAKEVYQTVMKNFKSSSQLVEQARQLLKALES